MFTVLSILFCAIIAGAILLRMGFKLQMERALDITVFVLIALFGLSIGQDDNLLHNASSIGWAALLIASLGMAGSVLFSWLYQRLLHLPNIPVAVAETADEHKQKKSDLLLRLLRSSKLPLVLLAGMLMGYYGLLPKSWGSSKVSFVVLCLLIAEVGLSLGNRPDLKTVMKSVDFKILLLPFFTIAGTLLFSALGAIVLPFSVRDVLTVGSGFGYYSLSSILILDQKAAIIGQSAAVELASLSLLINLLRELVALILCEPLSRSGRVYQAVSLAGVTSMDVCLPMIVNSRTSPQNMPIAIVHGIVLEISVPLLLSVLC